MSPPRRKPRARTQAQNAGKLGPPRPKKLPSQERSRALVESLLRATARILALGGWDALTTNRVAAEAGASVGSLYQYFPNKEALVAALLDEWVEAASHRLIAELSALASLPLDVCLRRMVAMVLAVPDEDASAYRAVLVQLPRIGSLDAFERMHRRVADALADWIVLRRSELNVEDPSLTAYTIVCALDAVTDQVLLLRPELLRSQRFAEQLARLVAGALGVSAVPSGAAPAP